MITQSSQQSTQVAISDPMLMLTKLLIKIDQREKVIERLQKEGIADDEDNQRSSDSASQSE